METKNKTILTKDVEKKQIIVKRSFDAAREQVWSAWTEREKLDLWWAPKPWKAKTKSMDFREGGKWIYAMVGPDGTTHWAFIEYKQINPVSNFKCMDAFCDENGVLSAEFPTMEWNVNFNETGSGTEVVVEIKFETEEDLKKILELGFAEGFTAALGNLDDLLVQ